MTKNEIKRLIAAVLAALAVGLGGGKLLPDETTVCPNCGMACVAPDATGSE